MGAGSSLPKLFTEWTPHDVDSGMKSLGKHFHGYSTDILEYGIDGKWLSAIDEKEFEEILDDLEVDVRLQRRKLRSEWRQLIQKQSDVAGKKAGTAIELCKDSGTENSPVHQKKRARTSSNSEQDPRQAEPTILEDGGVKPPETVNSGKVEDACSAESSEDALASTPSARPSGDSEMESSEERDDDLSHANASGNTSDDGGVDDDDPPPDTASSTTGHTHMKPEPRSDPVNDEENEGSKSKVKTEKDAVLNQAKEHRKYGDRVLLARQHKEGMLKLGGGNCGMKLFPGPNTDTRSSRLRYQAIGRSKAVAYDASYNLNGPQYAGQPAATLSYLHSKPGETFSVFMKREIRPGKLLGWEYCGEYYSPTEAIKFWDAAQNVPKMNKDAIAKEIISHKDAKGSIWHELLRKWRDRFIAALATDPSPAGPIWLVEGRDEPVGDEERNASMAARLRALNFRPNMSFEDLAELLVKMDEFYSQKSVVFVGYREDVYDFVKDGETACNAQGRPRKKYGGRCAKASDWYNICDQRLR